jgi:nitrite reductase/ring-hydroxylating ferredoxin subunit
MSLAEPGWIPVALGRDLEPSSSMGALIAGAEVVVWRDRDGAAHAWEDRCPHRGMRLSFGFVRGNHIACLYHGWEYGTDGQCRKIPAHPELEVPRAIKANRYGCREASGIVWVSLAGEDVPFEVDIWENPFPVRSLYCDRNAEELTELLSADAGLPEAFGAGAVGHTGSGITIKLRGARLVAAVHPWSENRSALHLVLVNTDSATAEHMGPALLAWSEALRRRLERVPAREARRLEGAVL